MSEYAYLNLYTREAMAKMLVLRDERIDQLKAENTKLRELCYEIWEKARLCDANKKIKGMRILDEYGHELEERMRELGIPTDE